MVTIALPNSIDWFVAVVACWKLGAIPQPVSARLPARELEAIVELADPKVVVGVGRATSRRAGRACPLGYAPPPTHRRRARCPTPISPAWKAPTSGGSTGRPKLIVSGDPAELDAERRRAAAARPATAACVMPGPLYHNGPLVWSCQRAARAATTSSCCRASTPRRRSPPSTTHRADIVYLVPTMMKRIWRLPEDVRARLRPVVAARRLAPRRAVPGRG